MNTDRFKNYQDNVKQLVLDFEAMQNCGGSRFYDVDQLETIIDFYLETADGEMLEKSVRYGEELFPASTEIRLRRVHLLCFKERYNEAYHLLQQLEQMEPDNTDVLYALGVIHSALDHPRKAIQYYHKAAADGYDLGAIYRNIADEYEKTEQREMARNYYRKALKINPDDEHSLYELANCYEDDGLSEKWIKYFSRFVADHPYSKVGWFCLGEAYLSVQLYEHAGDAYQYAIVIDETFLYAYLQLAECQLAENPEQFQGAVNTLHDALEFTDDKAYIYNRIGDIYRFSNEHNISTAEIYYRKATKEDPFYSEAWHNLAIAYSMQQSYESAIDAAKRAIKIDPESPLFLTTLALIYGDYGEYDEANKIFECAIPYYTDFEQGWLAYADYLTMLQRYDEAIEALNTGLADCDMVLEFNKRLVYCYFHTGERNLLYNAVRACLYCDKNGEVEMLKYCPELREDLQVMDIIIAHRQDSL